MGDEELLISKNSKSPTGIKPPAELPSITNGHHHHDDDFTAGTDHRNSNGIHHQANGGACVIYPKAVAATTTTNPRKQTSESIIVSNISITKRESVKVDDISTLLGSGSTDLLAVSNNNGSNLNSTAVTTATNSTYSLGMPASNATFSSSPSKIDHNEKQQQQPAATVHRPSVVASRPTSGAAVASDLDEAAVAAALMAKHPATADEQSSLLLLNTAEHQKSLKLTTVDPDGCVKLRLSPATADIVPHTVYGILSMQARKMPTQLALRVKREGKWLEWTYRDYYEDVVRAAKSFVKLGLKPAHGVGILGFNAPEWFISDLGAITAGGVAVGIYTTNSAEACQYVAENSRCNVIVVEDEKYLERIMQVRSHLPELKAVVQYTGKINNPKYAAAVAERFLLTWQQFMALSEDDDDAYETASSSPSNSDAETDEIVAKQKKLKNLKNADDILQQRIDALAPNKCCTIIYTSGTTGNPKGAMLSHDNVLFTATDAIRASQLACDGSEVYVSYLPLSHVAAQQTDVYIPLVSAGCVNFAQPDALKGSLGETLRECRPTAVLGVPRVWEKIQEKMQSAGRSAGFMKRHLAAWAKSVGLRGSRAMLADEPDSMPFGWSLANAIVFKKVRQILGLDRCRLCATGAAPMALETFEYFLSLNLPIYEIYGMSESTGPHALNLPFAHRLMSVGRTLPGCETRIDQPNADGNGEICMRGRNVFMGYLGMPEKTLEAVDADGWLHSGDIGRIDADGFLFITGRLKELIITAGGENVAPVPVEDLLKEQCPLISNAMLIGDKRKFLSILVTLKCEQDRDSGAPTDVLLPLACDYLKEHGVSADIKTVTEARQDKAVRELINKAVEQTNKKVVSRAARIAKFEILPQDFSIPGGELGPTMKLRRPVVAQQYSELIEGLYAGGGGGD